MSTSLEVFIPFVKDQYHSFLFCSISPELCCTGRWWLWHCARVADVYSFVFSLGDTIHRLNIALFLRFFFFIKIIDG